MKLKSISGEKQQRKELMRRLSGELLSEVAEHVKAAQLGEDLENAVLDEEAERQRRISEGNNPYVPEAAEIATDDRERSAAALAQVHMLEEQERTRRMSEAEEEEKMDSDISRAVTALEEEAERTMRLCDEEYVRKEESRAHLEASLVREKIETDRDDEHDREVMDSQADLIGTVIDEIEEKRRRISTGDAAAKIHGHMTAGMVKEHLVACKHADVAVEAQREADLIGCYVDEMEERERRSSLPVKRHDLVHAHKEAEIIANDPLRWELPAAAATNVA